MGKTTGRGSNTSHFRRGRNRDCARAERAPENDISCSVFAEMERRCLRDCVKQLEISLEILLLCNRVNFVNQQQDVYKIIEQLVR